MFGEDDWNIPPTVKTRVKMPGAAQRDRVEYVEHKRGTPTRRSDGASPRHCAADSPSVRPDPRLEPAPSSVQHMFEGDDQLYSQLLDDLDNISSDVSANKRKKATQIFSSWIFSPAPLRTGAVLRAPTQRTCTRAELSARRFTADFTEFDVVNSECSDLQRSPLCKPFCRNEPLRHSTSEHTSVRTKELATCRRASDGSVAIDRPRSAKHATTEDDADSGYHTGNSVVLGAACRKGAVEPSEERRAVLREDLRRRIGAFNHSSHISHGLLIEMPREDDTFRGAVRVRINLIRPINMCTSVKPPSLFDAAPNDTVHEDVEITSFYLPQHTTTVIHVASNTTTPEVIRALLSKFKITDSPRKFALYEKNQNPEKKTTSMRRMSDKETPLPTLLSWADKGLANLESNEFVLQENDAGEIMWDEFSLPELDNFLSVLNREEDEYIDQVRTKYRILRMQILKRLSDKPFVS